MDFDYSNGNVKMHSCHDGDNQKWYIESDGSVSPVGATRAPKAIVEPFDNAEITVESASLGTKTFSALDCPDAISIKGHWHVFTYNAQTDEMEWACGDDIPAAKYGAFDFGLRASGGVVNAYNATEDPNNWDDPDLSDKELSDNVQDLEDAISDVNATRMAEIHEHAAAKLDEKIKSGALGRKFLGRAASAVL